MIIKRTPLHGIATMLGGRMFDRPGYLVPQYFSDPKEEHIATREAAALFEIFGQFLLEVKGAGAEAFLQRRTVADVSQLRPGRVVYCSILNEKGGIIDDVTLFRVGEDRFWVVPAPARAATVEAYFLKEAAGGGLEIVLLGYKYTSLSLQGPNSRHILTDLAGADLSTSVLPYFSFTRTTVAGIADVVLSRTGFTGELGYELFVPTEHVASVYLKLLGVGAKHGLVPGGLGAMGSLRLEKKFIIFGLDIDETTTPVEAGLGWTVKLRKPDFVGRSVIEKQLQEGTSRQLVLLAMDPSAAPPLPGQPVRMDGTPVGKVTTSGTGYTVGHTLALAMVDGSAAVAGQRLHVGAAAGEAAVVHLKAPYDPTSSRARV
jgi:aminomethyltransferase